MDSITEERVLQWALAEGFLTAEELAEQVGEVARLGPRLAGVVRAGYVSASHVERFLDRISPLDNDDSPAGPVPDSGGPRGGNGAHGADRFEVGDLLGEGGMAKVFKAYDKALKRPVALKFLKSDAPDRITRFLREAQAQARVVHENVCKIYEVGEYEGKPYIAMQVIEGQPLFINEDESTKASPTLQQMTVEQKARLMQKVAEGINAAHREGLIHRDIKPSNIMLEVTEEGEFKPYVLDFGLAREVASASETSLGLAAGTPNFMAPEQARGESGALDRRTDVYGLGATLYALLSGDPPFTGPSSLDVLVKVTEQEAPPLVSVPADLATIVEKCLQKEPSQRYESARALAEELGRYLDGEPIQARKASLFYRLRKKAKKHQKVVATAAVASVAFVVLAGWSAVAQLKSAQRTRLAAVFGQEVKGIESQMQITHMLPEHDIRPEKAEVRQRMSALDAQIRAIGRVAEGPGHYALGRGYLALGEMEKAREQLERSWNGGYHEREVAYALGLVLGALYQKELMAVDRIADKKQQEAKRLKVQAEYRDPALRYLAQSRGLRVESPEYVEALVAFYEKRYDTALQKTKAAYQRRPALYEARALEGTVYAAIARDASNQSQNAAGMEAIARAKEAYAGAAAIGRSDPAISEGQCSLTISVLFMKLYASGGDLTPEFAAGLTACDRALAIDAETAGAYLSKSIFFRRMAEVDQSAGRDPRPNFAKTIEAVDRYLEFQPGDPKATFQVATIAAMAASYEAEHGLDPSASVAKSNRYSEQMMKAYPNDSAILNLRGIVFRQLAIFQSDRGLDPSLSMRQSEDAFKTAVAAAPKGIAVRNSSTIYLTEVDHQLRNGGDPTLALAAAKEAAQRAIAVAADSHFNHLALCEVYGMQAEYDLAGGHDPQPNVDHALESCRRSLAINPKFRGTLTRMAQLYLLAGRGAFEQGRSPQPMIDESTKWIAQAGPENSSRATEAGIALLEGRWQMARGASPEAALARSRKALEKAIEVNPSHPDTYAGLAEVDWQLAQWHHRDRSVAGQAVTRGLNEVEKALALNPRHARALAIRGALDLERSRLDAANHATLQANAKESFDQAVAINRFLDREYGTLIAEARQSTHDRR